MPKTKGFKHIPTEILINDILPRLSLTELINLCLTDKRIAKICENDQVWNNKILLEYPHIRLNMKPIGMSSKDFYYRLRNPRGVNKLLYTYDDYGYPNSKLYPDHTLTFYPNMTSLATIYNFLFINTPDSQTVILSFVYSDPTLFTQIGMNLLNTILNNQIITLIIRKDEAFSTLSYEQFIELAPWFAENVCLIQIITSVNLDLTFSYDFSEQQLKSPLF